MHICKRVFKDTHQGNASTNNTQTLTKKKNTYTSIVATLNQLFIRGSYSPINFSNK